MIVLDASVLIGYLEARDAHHAAALRLLADTDDELAVSVVTMAELLVGPVRNGTAARAQQVLSALGVIEHPLPQDAAVELATLRTTSGLRLPDCCVLLTAQELNAGIATFDAALARGASAHGVPLA